MKFKCFFLQFSQGNIDFVTELGTSFKAEISTIIGNLRNRYTQTVNMIRGLYLNTE